MSIKQQLEQLKRKLQKFKLARFSIFLCTCWLTVQFFILPGLTQQTVTVKILIQALQAAQWEPLVQKFNTQHEKINLELVKAPNDSNIIEDLYSSAFLLGDSPYDLIYMDIVWVQKFAAAGWLESLEDRVSEATLAEYFPGDVDGGRYQGELYRMPLRSDVGMLYYRTDLLNEAGYQPPETFSDLIEISQALQKQTNVDWGYVWQGKQYEGLSAMFVEILEGFGGYWVNPETLEVGLDQPEAIAAVEFLRNAIASGISPPGVTTYGEEETRRFFQSGNAIFLRNWPYVVPLAADSEISGKFAIKAMPHLPGENSGACLGGWGLGIAKSSPHPDAAWSVIEYFNQVDTQRELLLITGFVPSRKSLFTDPVLVAKYDYYPKLLEVAENSVLRPPIAQYAQVSDILQRYLSAALTNRIDTESAMEAAASETRRLLVK
ncbi:MAG: ABC transporter substrate-binding protein [Oscillatoria sp. PMC 1068.18]|nr:ABC transporter substrate-binding protein [Oscillatoria sp. PMC 1076.18]MEC4988708.1 ABC transporter substrate-binding protein [Oscillatoria sp. PMC 1068.18]